MNQGIITIIALIFFGTVLIAAAFTIKVGNDDKYHIRFTKYLIKVFLALLGMFALSIIYRGL